MTDKSAGGDRLAVPVGVAITAANKTYVFGGQVVLIYKATAGKGGKAAKAK